MGETDGNVATDVVMPSVGNDEGSRIGRGLVADGIDVGWVPTCSIDAGATTAPDDLSTAQPVVSTVAIAASAMTRRPVRPGVNVHRAAVNFNAIRPRSRCASASSRPVLRKGGTREPARV